MLCLPVQTTIPIHPSYPSYRQPATTSVMTSATTVSHVTRLESAWYYLITTLGRFRIRITSCGLTCLPPLHHQDHILLLMTILFGHITYIAIQTYYTFTYLDTSNHKLIQTPGRQTILTSLHPVVPGQHLSILHPGPHRTINTASWTSHRSTTRYRHRQIGCSRQRMR